MSTLILRSSVELISVPSGPLNKGVVPLDASNFLESTVTLGVQCSEVLLCRVGGDSLLLLRHLLHLPSGGGRPILRARRISYSIAIFRFSLLCLTIFSCSVTHSRLRRRLSSSDLVRRTASLSSLREGSSFSSRCEFLDVCRSIPCYRAEK